MITRKCCICSDFIIKKLVSLVFRWYQRGDLARMGHPLPLMSKGETETTTIGE